MKHRSFNVLHISFSDSGGGAELFAFNFVSDNGFKLAVKHSFTKSPLIIPLGKNFFDRLFELGSKVIWKLGIKKDLKFLLSITEYFNFTHQKLLKLEAYRSADIIHLHNIHGSYFDLSDLKKIAKDKPIVWTLHDMWAFTGGEAHTFENENYKLGIGQTPYKKEYPLRDPFIDLRTHSLYLKKKIYAAISERITFVPVSSWLEKCFTDSYVYYPSLRVKKITNGIDLEVFKDYEQRNWSKPRILIFHSTSSTKNSAFFFELIDHINEEFELIIIGKEYNPQRFKNVGYLKSTQEIAKVYNQVDIFIYPSKAESFGLMVAEAMACGVCVMANNTSALVELVTPDKGLLFDINDKNSFIKKLSSLIRNLTLARELGKEGARRISKEYDVKDMYEKYEELYSSILPRYNS